MTHENSFRKDKPNKNNKLSSYSWPPNDICPLNLDEERNILSIVTEDIRSSTHYLIVTGYTSLAHIVTFLGNDTNVQRCEVVEIVLGFEPEVKRRNKRGWGTAKLDKEIKEYWLERGFSILDGGNIIKMIELIRKDKIKFKFLHPLHAKINVGTYYAMIGSANFSFNGLTKQLEADLRIGKNTNNSFEKQLYDYISKIARNYYEAREDYKEEIVDLLEKLLKVTKWEEALARAISELLEGKWFTELSQLYSQIENIKLWPFQERNLAEALYILQNKGCILIANPTGSGKTKLISIILLLLNNWLWETGRRKPSYPIVICPPVITQNWDRESVDSHLPKPASISMGLLSNSASEKSAQILKQIKIANILVIDEAHNLLNIKSTRSENVAKNRADYIILSTATPISKKVRDLFRLIELLDIDNLSDAEINEFKKLKSKNLRSESDINLLRGHVSKFMLRQTKAEIKKYIKREPEKYKDKFGNPCQYPKNKNYSYKVKSTKKDVEVAQKINNLAKQLKGLVYLRNFEFKKYWEITEEQFVKMRIEAAPALSLFHLQACLRSSRAAVIEIVEGTEAAAEYFKFEYTKTNSGNFVAKIEDFKSKLPAIRNVPKDILPIWLTDKKEYQKVCQREIEIYLKISELAKTLSDSRELSKINKIIKLFGKHNLVIAFDSTVITLDYFKKLIVKKYSKIQTSVVTGTTGKQFILRKFELGSKEKNVLGLFSDCMSEGVNLQQASAMVMLDMPCILRIAEQRIGRIDRLDSPHQTISVYWPNDDNEFALRGDSRLIKTLQSAKNLIGANFDIPEEIINKHIEKIDTDEIITPKDMQRDLKEENIENREWEDIQTSFKSVRELFDSKEALILFEQYKYLKEVDATVKVKMSIFESPKKWLFVAFKGTKAFPPKWYFIDSQEIIYSSLPKICDLLRLHLKDEEQKEKEWDERAEQTLSLFLNKLLDQQKKLLPNKKRRALEVAEYILQKQREKNENEFKSDLYKELLSCFQNPKIDEEEIVDLYTFAQQWLTILTPYVREKRYREKRNTIGLNDLKQDYAQIELTREILEQILLSITYKKSPKYNIASCILGVPDTDKKTS